MGKNWTIKFLILLSCIFILNNNIIASLQESNQVVKIGDSPNYGVINTPHIKGKEGFGFEYFKEISKYTNHNYQFISVKWDQAFDMLLDGKIDLFGPVGITDKRLETFEYTKNKFGNEEVFLISLNENKILYGDYKVTISMILGALLIYFLTIFKLIKKRNYSLKTLLEVDQLTGLMTRYKFIVEVKEKLKKVNPKEYLILSIDIDNFKYINKVYGYHLGNEVLKAFADNLITCFEKNSIIMRESNDNFIMLIKNNFNGKTFCKKENCEDCILKGIYEILGKEYKISISKGVYIIDNPKNDVDYMIDCANTARLKGKEKYGTTLFEFTEKMKKEQIIKNMIVSNMEYALKNKEFFIVFQPKYNLISEKIIGAEALVRWKSKGNFFYPNDFIPIFEANGFIIKLDYYIFDKVCEFIKKFIQNNVDLKISINLSGETLLEDNLIETYSKILNKYNISSKFIEIEITESAVINNFRTVNFKINELKKLGFKVSMDDFGTGISSLNRLQDISVDIIKLDRGFINSTLSKEKGVRILKNIIMMSKDLNLITVAEGIETKEQLELLKELGCNIGQGYYFAKPLDIKEFLKKIKNESYIGL